MEWVEVTGPSVDVAVEAALAEHAPEVVADEIGVPAAEISVKPMVRNVPISALPRWTER